MDIDGYIEFFTHIVQSGRLSDMITGGICVLLVWVVYAGAYLAGQIFGEKGVRVWGAITWFLYQGIKKDSPSETPGESSSTEEEIKKS